MSRLIWIYAVCKGLLLLPVTVKELKSGGTEFQAPAVQAVKLLRFKLDISARFYQTILQKGAIHF